jgi:hypothetical protein
MMTNAAGTDYISILGIHCPIVKLPANDPGGTRPKARRIAASPGSGQAPGLGKALARSAKIMASHEAGKWQDKVLIFLEQDHVIGRTSSMERATRKSKMPGILES